MKVTTEDILTFLPLSPELKTKIEVELVKPNSGKRLALVDLLWVTYYELFEQRLQTNLDLERIRIQESEEPIPQDFYKRVVEKTKQEIQAKMNEGTTQQNLESVRNKLQSILATTN